MIALENKDQSLNYESAVHVSSRSWQTADLRGIVIINTPCNIFLYSVLSRKGVRHVTIPRMLFPKQLFFFIPLKHKTIPQSHTRRGNNIHRSHTQMATPLQ